MNLKYLHALSHKSKTHFESREFQLAANILHEAREHFKPAEGERLVQDNDGSIVVEYKEVDERNGQEHVRRRPIETE